MLNAPHRERAVVDPPRPSGLNWPWLAALLLPAFGAGWVTRGRVRSQPLASADAAGSPTSEATAAFELAGALAETDDVEGAESAYRRADQLGHPAAASNLGVLLERRGDLAGAEAAYRRADERGDATGAFNLGSLFAEQGDLRAAEGAFARADQRGSAEAALNLGLILQWRGDLAGAHDAFDRADERGGPELIERAQAALAELHEQA